jgi:hypothetical protein
VSRGREREDDEEVSLVDRAANEFSDGPRSAFDPLHDEKLPETTSPLSPAFFKTRSSIF